MSLIRCRRARLAINLIAINSRTHVHFPRDRAGFADNRSPLPPTKPDATPEYTTSGQYIQDRFSGNVLSAVKNLGKIFAWVGYGTIIIGLVAVTAYEGAHVWIEHKMSILPDEDAERWGWESESWSGGKLGGTSPALGLYGRHAARAAWFALHYHSSLTAGISSISPDDDGADSENIGVIDADLHNARVYLETALSCMKNRDGTLRSDKVVYALLERHAAVLERIGTRAALVKARDDYTSLYESDYGTKISQAKFAVKLGNILNRLGDGESALNWWLRGIDLTRDGDHPDKITVPATSSTAESMTLEPVAITEKAHANALWNWTQSSQSRAETAPLDTEVRSRLDMSSPPSSPAAQRTLVTALLALSTYYTWQSRLQAAKEVQERAISLINAMVPPASTPGSQTMAQALHYIYLIHRKSVMTLHHAEVTYAVQSQLMLEKRSVIMDALTQLMRTASLSEQVVKVLTDQASPESCLLLAELTSHPAIAKLEKSSASKPGLAPNLANSPYLQPAAQGILRDARLTAAEAWDLSGVLYGKLEDNKSVECFERALVWAGEPIAAGRDQEGMSVKAWEMLWARYVREKKKRTD